MLSARRNLPLLAASMALVMNAPCFASTFDSSILNMVAAPTAVENEAAKNFCDGSVMPSDGGTKQMGDGSVMPSNGATKVMGDGSVMPSNAQNGNQTFGNGGTGGKVGFADDIPLDSGGVSAGASKGFIHDTVPTGMAPTASPTSAQGQGLLLPAVQKLDLPFAGATNQHLSPSTAATLNIQQGATSAVGKTPTITPLNPSSLGNFTALPAAPGGAAPSAGNIGSAGAIILQHSGGSGAQLSPVGGASITNHGNGGIILQHTAPLMPGALLQR